MKIEAVEPEEQIPKGRILALDVGARRIGLALSDELMLTAQGLETLQRTTLREDIARLATLAAGHGVTLVLMGNPMNMSGTKDGNRPGSAILPRGCTRAAV